MSGSTARRMKDVLRHHGEDSRPAMTVMNGPAGISKPLLYLDPNAYFQHRARRWQRETRFLSSVSEILEHPDCQEILSMGARALPFALAALEQQVWTWAPVLERLTGQQPVAEENLGNADAVRMAWREWGEQRGLRW